MIRKKGSAKEETEGRQENEHPENKDNSEVKEHGDQVPAEEMSGTEALEQSTGATEQEVKSTDKDGSPVITSEEKLAEMQDKYIRLSAEFDNYRKRTLREKMELSKYASEKILLNLLPFMDDFERALKNIEDTKDCTAVKDGIDLIHMKFMDFLRQSGVTEVETLNCAFNIDIHDAVAKVQVEDDNMKGKVVDVVLKGYYLQDKVIRHSKVVVGE